jgi:hypothetical protein
VRGWTTSPNPAYRFVLLALSFVLLIIWMHLRWLFIKSQAADGAAWISNGFH